MSDRFFSNIPIESELVVIDGDQAHHIRNVMRLREGANAILFDGLGKEFRATLIRVDRREVEFQITESVDSSREIDREIHIASALPKGDRQKFLIEKLVELGVREFTPLQTQRSVVVGYDKTIERLNKQVVEASKQCGRNRLMSIMPTMRFEKFVTARSDHSKLIIAHPVSNLPISQVEFRAEARYQFLVGPEGGFTDDELDAALNNNWSAVSLGPTILRIETAAIALATAAGIANLRN